MLLNRFVTEKWLRLWLYFPVLNRETLASTVSVLVYAYIASKIESIPEISTH